MMVNDRTELINKLIKENGYTKYLEIGVDQASNITQINCDYKVGVDPVKPPITEGYNYLLMTSDEYFQGFKQHTFDIIFIDGLHTYSQAIKDLNNALKILRPGGVIVMHDMLPTNELVATPAESYEHIKHLTGAWTGDVWKVLKQVIATEEFSYLVHPFDWGVTEIRPLSDEWRELVPEAYYENFEFKEFLNMKEELFS